MVASNREARQTTASHT